MKIDFNFIQVFDGALPVVHNRVLGHKPINLANPVILLHTIVWFIEVGLVDMAVFLCRLSDNG